MITAVATRQPHPESKTTKRFEFGYEKNFSDRRSVQTARAASLSIILDTKQIVVFDLLARAYQPFADLLQNNAIPIESISQAAEAEIPDTAPRYLRRMSIGRFLPNWKTAQEIAGAEALCDALKTWAQHNNLTDEWCIDNAVAFLCAWDTADYRKMAIDRMSDTNLRVSVVSNCWQSALRERRLYPLSNQIRFYAEVEERGVLFFTFKHEHVAFKVVGPFSKPVAAFKREVEQEFEAHGGRTIRGAKKALQYQLDSYLSQVELVSTELELDAPYTCWAITDHLNWLAQYQLAPCKTYRQIAREVEKDEKTVREGIRHSASLIGLTLRSNDGDKRSGRPKGAKDKAPRRRVDHRREKLRGNAA